MGDAAAGRTEEEAFAELRARIAGLAPHGRMLVGYSGGADSALLAHAAHQALGAGAVAVTAVSASLPAAERSGAAELARRHGFAHVEVRTDELTRPEYRANAGDRCYHCKSALLDALAPLAAQSGAVIALGTNLDDLGDHRPGQQAAAERGAVAPLVAAGLSKDEVRAVSRWAGLGSADKPAAACLSSRVAYGDPVTAEVLARIEQAEAALHALGFPVCRVRAHAAGSVARLELPEADLSRAVLAAAEIDAAVCGAGFDFCSVDLRGFRSGRMNVLLGLPTVAR
jgi:pyridinium-3,5-biscarboxylic acid mononucleotide sulfurtransferase